MRRGAAFSPPKAAWTLGKSSGLEARNPGSSFSFCSVAVSLCDSVNHISQNGCKGCPGFLPGRPQRGRMHGKKKKKKTTLRVPERSRKQQQRETGGSAWPSGPCLLMGLLPTLPSLLETQLLALEPPGSLKAGM